MVIFRTQFESSFRMLKTRWLPKQDGLPFENRTHLSSFRTVKTSLDRFINKKIHAKTNIGPFDNRKEIEFKKPDGPVFGHSLYYKLTHPVQHNSLQFCACWCSSLGKRKEFLLLLTKSTRGKIFSLGPTSLQTNNFLTLY
jgi:hypothetical protein